MLDTLSAEFGFSSPVPLSVLAVRLLGATLLCGLIGLEREIRENAAGLRTNMLVGLAAAAFALITLHFVESADTASDAIRMDPVRLIEAATAGVAFLAAGVIVYTQGSVRGVTTGASMWLAAAIGLSCGIGFWPLAIAASALGLTILAVLRRIEARAGFKE